MKKNNILIPVDGAAFSLQILPCIRRFLNPTENHLTLLRVEPEPEAIHIHQAGFEDIDIYVDETEASLRSNFADELLPTVRALENLGFSVTTEVEFGETIPTLEAYIAKQEVDLVAMRTHGRTGLSRIIYGSVAEHLLHHVDVPVLLLHPLHRQQNGKQEQAEMVPLV